MEMSRTFSTVLFHTVTVWPELSRFLTMPLPMMPRPRNPKLSLLGWMSFSLNIWLLVTWRDESEVANMVAAKQICMIKIAELVELPSPCPRRDWQVVPRRVDPEGWRRRHWISSWSARALGSPFHLPR